MEKELYYFSPPSLLSARTAQLGLVSYAARFPRVTYSLSPQRPSRPAQQRHPRSPLSRRVSLTSRSCLSAASSPSSSSCLARHCSAAAESPWPPRLAFTLRPKLLLAINTGCPQPCLPNPSFKAASLRRRATLALAAATELNLPKLRTASIRSAPW